MHQQGQHGAIRRLREYLRDERFLAALPIARGGQQPPQHGACLAGPRIEAHHLPQGGNGLGLPSGALIFPRQREQVAFLPGRALGGLLDRL